MTKAIFMWLCTDLLSYQTQICMKWDKQHICWEIKETNAPSWSRNPSEPVRECPEHMKIILLNVIVFRMLSVLRKMLSTCFFLTQLVWTKRYENTQGLSQVGTMVVLFCLHAISTLIETCRTKAVVTLWLLAPWLVNFVSSVRVNSLVNEKHSSRHPRSLAWNLSLVPEEGNYNFVHKKALCSSFRVTFCVDPWYHVTVCKQWAIDYRRRDLACFHGTRAVKNCLESKNDRKQKSQKPNRERTKLILLREESPEEILLRTDICQEYRPEYPQVFEQMKKEPVQSVFEQ